VGSNAVGQAQPLEMLEAREQRRLVDTSRPRARPRLDAAIILGATLELTVERSETLLGDLVGLRAADLEFMTVSELLGRKLLRAPAKAIGDVPAVEAHFTSLSVDAAKDDVRVRPDTKNI
jgi:hypothetical protein